MVYVKDEVNKFDADRLLALQKLANNSNDLAVLEKTTNMQCTQIRE
jgi:hypothetical protein